MALISCPECQKQVSDKASSCPNCGHPIQESQGNKNIFGQNIEEASKVVLPAKNKNSISAGAGCLIIMAVFLIPVFMYSMCSGSDEPSKPKTQEELRKDRLSKNFSAWDGSHNGLTQLIKQSMHDPKSYEHEETKYTDNGDHLIIYTTYRGKNVFGGVVKNQIIAKVDLNGNVLKIISE